MNTWRLLPAVTCLFLWVPIPACLGQAPARGTKVGTLPDRHGIAVYGPREHHVDLALAILEAQDDPSERCKRLSAELQLRAEQCPRLRKVVEKAFELAPNPENLTDAQFYKVADAMEVRVLEQFPKVLSGKQQARFEELSCQLGGPMVLRFNHYASRLGLSASQRKRVDQFVETYTEKVAQEQRTFFTSSADTHKRLKALARELDQRILGVLTEKQRAKWTSLLGKKFDWTGILAGQDF